MSLPTHEPPVYSFARPREALKLCIRRDLMMLTADRDPEHLSGYVPMCLWGR